MILEEIRNLAFWSLDALHGGPVRMAYKQIHNIDHLNSDDQRVHLHQQESFTQLVKHVHATVPFYKLHNGRELDEFPVVNKSLIKNHQDAFISKQYKKNDLKSMSTSGSTGTPFVCYQNVEKRQRVIAEIIYYSEKAGYRVGYPLIYLRSLVRDNKKSELKQYLQNQPLYSCRDLSDNGIQTLIHKVSNQRKAILLAYASTYDVMLKYFSRNGIDVIPKAHLNGIVSGSEMLFDETRQAMERAFRCRCVSRYSNQEQGVIGQDDKENNVFILNETDYIIEILDLVQDVPAAVGQVGRIVITDLFNYAMPFIRYDTGDVGMICTVPYKGNKKKAICKFGGRVVDIIYDCHNNVISPHTITNAMWSFSELRQFQLLQLAPSRYILKVNADESEQLSKRLIKSLIEALGPSAQIVCEYVNEIPVLASGKRKYIVNNMESG